MAFSQCTLLHCRELHPSLWYPQHSCHGCHFDVVHACFGQNTLGGCKILGRTKYSKVLKIILRCTKFWIPLSEWDSKRNTLWFAVVLKNFGRSTPRKLLMFCICLNKKWKWRPELCNFWLGLYLMKNTYYIDALAYSVTVWSGIMDMFSRK